MNHKLRNKGESLQCSSLHATFQQISVCLKHNIKNFGEGSCSMIVNWHKLVATESVIHHFHRSQTEVALWCWSSLLEWASSQKSAMLPLDAQFRVLVALIFRDNTVHVMLCDGETCSARSGKALWENVKAP